VAGRELSAQLALDLSVAAAQVLTAPGSRRPVAVVGRDPRASGEFLEAAVVAGLASAGVDVLRLGVLPTPGVAYLVKALDADFGVVLSASHNPARDNGIKFFARGGRKLADQVEDQIEARLGQATAEGRLGQAAAGTTAFGRVIAAEAEQEKYLDHLVASLGSGPIPAQPPLAGLRVVVDCAHGAAYAIAPEALRRAGAEVIAIGVEPDGDNINAGCGSTHLDTVASVVRSQAADAGIAHDGDADRCLAVDADGQVVDGDQILAVLATELKQEGRLAGDTVVVTVMSNLGFRMAMDDAGISVVETPVGDRYVLEAMLAGQHNLGGEQSGHIILADYATTGDGVLTALHLLAVLARRGVSLAEAAKVMTRYPQVLINVPGDKERAAASPELAAAVAEAERSLGGSGRILVRPSGTEPIIRVMVEAVDTAAAEHIAHQVADTIRRPLA
jgi:phosphoglucosamine mutase